MDNYSVHLVSLSYVCFHRKYDFEDVLMHYTESMYLCIRYKCNI